LCLGLLLVGLFSFSLLSSLLTSLMIAACLQAVEEAAATANTADPSPVFTARAEDNQSASTWTGTKRAKLKQVHWSGKERGDEFEADFSFDDTVYVQSVRRLKLRRDMATGYAQCREASCPKPQFGTHRTDSLHSAQKHCRAHHAPEKKAPNLLPSIKVRFPALRSRPHPSPT
jgi:hypothetical protein